MEALLTVRESVCLRCGHALRFRLSRFGCVYACECGTVVDLQSVLRSFVRRLDDGDLALPFFPILEGTGGITTGTAPHISIEVHSETRRVLLFFRHVSDTARAALLQSLPLALQTHITLFNGASPHSSAAALPLEMFDVCVADLRAMCAEVRSGPARLFLSEPRHSVVERSRRAAPAEATEAHVTAQLPVLLARTLKTHQVRGIAKMLAFSGRTLLADEMGVGKTLQALGVISILGAFPLLIICPSAVKVMWAEEIETFLFEQVPFRDIHLVHGANSALPETAQPKVVVISYHMAAVLASSLLAREWACVLCDESHLLRTNTNGADAQYTTVAVALCKRARHCLLLTGTPAPTSPFDMYNQLDAVCPGLFASTRWEFALRYTSMSFTPYVHMGPCTRQEEIGSLLRTTCLLRRTKKEVLDLPAKTRLIVRLIDRDRAASTGDTSFQSRYARAWEPKRDGIAEAVSHFTDKYVRVVLFAHHIALLDELERIVKRRRISFIRIDGAVPAAARHALIASFERGEVRVAIMGITACAVGISLARAQCAVFCELPPDAAWLAQAEDRLHRLGQDSQVTIYYLLGVHSSFDTDHFAHLLGSHAHAHDVLDAEQATRLTFQHALHAHRGDTTPMAQPQKCGTQAQLASSPQSPDATGHLLSRDVLQFAVSMNTGRIHVRHTHHEPTVGPASTAAFPTLYWSASLLQARECVRHRTVPFWAQLDQFLHTLAMHSAHARRMIEKDGLWLPCRFVLKRSRTVPHSGSTMRYAPAPLLCGWGFWWLVQRHFSSTANSYFALLRCVRSRGGSRCFAPLCLHCASRPPSLVNVAVSRAHFLPGLVIKIEGDVAMFCCGACRESFYTRRSSGALRRSVLELDRGVCNHCHIDCENLCFLLTSVDGELVRQQIIAREHPHMLHFPHLVRKLVQHPVPGNCWHADHVVPVSQGGGQASLDNIQTLCVVCHAMKTQEDNRLTATMSSTVADDTAVVMATQRLSTFQAAREHLHAEHPTKSRVTLCGD